MMNKLFFYIIIFLSINNEEIKVINDGYYVYFSINKTGERAQTGSGIFLKKEDVLKLMKFNFINSFYENSYHCIPIPFGIDNIISKYSSINERDSIESEYLNTSMKIIDKSIEMKFNSKNIFYNFNIVKVSGEFLKKETDFKTINSISNQVLIEKNIYNKNEYYQIKKLVKIDEIDEKFKVKIYKNFK